MPLNSMDVVRNHTQSMKTIEAHKIIRDMDNGKIQPKTNNVWKQVTKNSRNIKGGKKEEIGIKSNNKTLMSAFLN